MSIDPLRQTRRYEGVDPFPPSPPPAGSKPTPVKEAPEVPYSIAYSAELFASVGRGGATAVAAGAATRQPRTPETIRPRSIEHPGITRAPWPNHTAPVSRDHLYTSNANEVDARGTGVDVYDLLHTIRSKWPELTDEGARTLVSQFMAETGSAGEHCYNWNVGNLKASPGQPHMYLRGTNEVEEPDKASAKVANSNGLAHIATAKEIADNHWLCPSGKALVVYDPPHPASAFRAFASLEDAVSAWIDKHKDIAALDASYIEKLNRGDTAAAAHALKRAGYYSMDEAAYATAMSDQKKKLDERLGVTQ